MVIFPSSPLGGNVELITSSVALPTSPIGQFPSTPLGNRVYLAQTASGIVNYTSSDGKSFINVFTPAAAAAIPEPSSGLLVLAGLCLLLRK